MNIKPIKSESDYNFSIKRIEELWGAKKDTTEGDELNLLVTLVEAYEMKDFPIFSPNTSSKKIDTIKMVMISPEIFFK